MHKKWRAFFSKTGMGKYISHLDLLRCFNRAIQRSGLPVVYSEGFNPHQRLTFALPLPVGVTSRCEAVDILFEDTADGREIMTRLAPCLPPDIRLLAVEQPVRAAADIAAAAYEFRDAEAEIPRDRLAAFFAAPVRMITKRSKKKGEQQVNLMDYIRTWEPLNSSGSGTAFRAVLDAGGNRNLKPDILAQALDAFLRPGEDGCWEMERVQLFCETPDGGLEVFR